jgi:hypothetical protein
LGSEQQNQFQQQVLPGQVQWQVLLLQGQHALLEPVLDWRKPLGQQVLESLH